MSIVRRERASFTVEQVTAAVKDSLGIVDDLELSDEDRSALLGRIFDKISQKEITYEEVGGVDLGGLLRPQG